ncbi:adenosylcobinamide amidohydrolase [Lysinibacillus sp. fkY74-1]|uniref:Iron ABC transporter ATPase n=3 Tax=Lysinibacillus TaxID=400634 RepID=W7S2N1_LYSSH|nr:MULTISPECIES: adenosylcobinamide amidohydrolase [Lysinibacillus]MBE5081986.1 adenosylcobinamide amidohydrolase [Bacillus thuringiensis]MBG9725848.1 iron ABC transporter ATPase [Lysinibacillus fusiformis]ACA38579.1 iron transport system ATP-binding protein [Lysinibacillus sphaericus C3-41]AMO31146.1 ABC transporter ATP-binding protein [Lysinibacillus sphaericus]AMR89747.1 ABC transporter ATP-binding protein [Lysinibacillus sphaericus]
MIFVEHLSGGYEDVPIVKDISFTVEKGKILGILGPNGSGKSTLLKVMSGILPAVEGTISIDGQNILSYNARALAKKMAVLPQLHANAFSNSVRETISLGRYPHQTGFFSSWSEQDEQAVQHAMLQTGIKRYEHTPMEFLSGGEQQRVFVAQALAQTAEILLLDEPTNHLDIAHQRQILDMVRKEAVECGLTVVMVLHDMNLASLYCDELLLMESGQMRAFGAPHEVLIASQIEEIYQARVATYAHPEIPKPQITMMPAASDHQQRAVIKKEHFKITEQFIQLQSEIPLKTVSSAVHNPGIGWHNCLLNRSVPGDYVISDVKREVNEFLQKGHFSPTNTVVMLTAVPTALVAINEWAAPFGSVIVAVTAGVGNAVDVSRVHERQDQPYIGTINTWVIINGCLSEEAFFQAMMTATEAKTKALQSENIRDERSGTIATGTATDSLLIAATQKGKEMLYGGPITEVGKMIAKGVFETTVQAIRNYKNEF